MGSCSLSINLVLLNGSGNMLFKCNCILFFRLNNLRTSHHVNGVYKRLGGVTNHKEVQDRAGVGSYYRRHEVTLTQGHWQVLEFHLL